MPSGRAPRELLSGVPWVLVGVTAIFTAACADGALPALGANDPANPTAPEAPFRPVQGTAEVPTASPIDSPAPSAAPHAHHHHGAP